MLAKLGISQQNHFLMTRCAVQLFTFYRDLPQFSPSTKDLTEVYLALYPVLDCSQKQMHTVNIYDIHLSTVPA